MASNLYFNFNVQNRTLKQLGIFYSRLKSECHDKQINEVEGTILGNGNFVFLISLWFRKKMPCNSYFNLKMLKYSNKRNVDLKF